MKNYSVYAGTFDVDRFGNMLPLKFLFSVKAANEANAMKQAKKRKVIAPIVGPAIDFH